MMDSIQGLRPDGRFIVMGADEEPLLVSLVELLFKRIKIIGSQQNGPEFLYGALDYVAQGKVRSIIEMYPLSDTAKAYERCGGEDMLPRCPYDVIANPALPDTM